MESHVLGQLPASAGANGGDTQGRGRGTKVRHTDRGGSGGPNGCEDGACISSNKTDLNYLLYSLVEGETITVAGYSVGIQYINSGEVRFTLDGTTYPSSSKLQEGDRATFDIDNGIDLYVMDISKSDLSGSVGKVTFHLLDNEDYVLKKGESISVNGMEIMIRYLNSEDSVSFSLVPLDKEYHTGSFGVGEQFSLSKIELKKVFEDEEYVIINVDEDLLMGY